MPKRTEAEIINMINSRLAYKRRQLDKAVKQLIKESPAKIAFKDIVKIHNDFKIEVHD